MQLCLCEERFQTLLLQGLLLVRRALYGRPAEPL